MSKKDEFCKPGFFGGAGRRGYHHGSLKDALLEAARSLVTERGLGGFTLAEAAKLVGVTAAAPYRHFTDRNALIAELAQRGFELFGQRLAGAWDAGRPDPRTALARMGSAYLAFAREEPGLYGAMFDTVGVLSAEAVNTAGEKALALLGQAATAVLMARGASPAGAWTLALEIWSVSHGIAMLARAGHLDGGREERDPATLLSTAVGAMVETAVRNGRAS